MRATDLVQTVGLTEPIRRWLRNNVGDPLREDIVSRWMNALSEDFPEDAVDQIRARIARIKIE